MNNFRVYFLFILIGIMFSCSDNSIEELVDTEGPEIVDLRWINSPFYDKDIGGPILDGENYTLSISDGFQIRLRIQDESLIAEGEGYFLINNDPNLIKHLFGPSKIFRYKEGSIGSHYQHRKLLLENGEFYTIQPEDSYHFYLSFTDEYGNSTEMQWTANLIE
ncbi:MAG: hypothetical protein P1U56_21120 [Saprospiraceae bacterium]|nr:hypothetical protein [Saprospiraceae bacterium]